MKIKFIKYLLFFCLCIISSILIINYEVKAINSENDSFLQDAKSGCLIECKTRKVLVSKQENKRLAPASMTKIMTMLLVMEKIESGTIGYNDMVITPKNAASLGGSQIYLSEGEKMSVHDLLKAMCIASANDAAMSLAVYVGGSEKMFVDMMNKKVNELGLVNTNYVNPYGFDDPNHYSSSYDMAIIASELINKYPKILEYTSIYEDYVREDTEKRFWLVNTNKLVRFMEGVDGLKTGWTNNSGYCLTATITKNNERFIAVAMGNSTPSIRNNEISELLQYGVNNFKTKTILSKDEIIDEIKDVSLSPSKVSLSVSEDVIIVKNKKDEIGEVEIVKNINFENNEFYVDVYYDNNLYKRVNLNLSTSYHKASIWNLMIEFIKELFLCTH